MSNTTANRESPFGTADSRLSALGLVLETCTRFENDRRQGLSPRVEDYLPGPDDPNRPRLLRELLGFEIVYRQAQGDTPTAAELERRFPGQSTLWSVALREAGPTETSAGIPCPTADPDFIIGAGEPAASSVFPGSVRPRFHVLRFLAKGGLGEVSVARDEELRREVAFKEIRPEFADEPTYRGRFVREALITGALDHPGIVPIYSLGHHADGRPYYAMRLIKGKTLQARLEDHRSEERRHGASTLSGQELLRAFIAVCQAIAYAHDRGFVHRDLKPPNIMIGDYGEILIVDWGLAKPLSRLKATPVEDEETVLVPGTDPGSEETAAGSVIGTPGYISPEQFLGDQERLGPASDVYSLGVMLYMLLTGRPAFSDLKLGDLKAKVCRGDFPPPRQVDATVPRSLEAICLKAMATDPDNRYRSAMELADEVKRWLADEPVAAYREPWSARWARWARKNRTLVAAAIVLLITSTVALAASNVLITRQKDVAVAAQKEADKNLELARSAIRAMTKLTTGALAILPGAEEARLLLAKSALEFHKVLSERMSQDPSILVDLIGMHHEVGNIHRQLGRNTPAAEAYQQAIEIVEDQTARMPGQSDVIDLLAGLELDAGEALRLEGWPHRAEAQYRDALERADWLLARSPNNPSFLRTRARALYSLAEIQVDTGRFDDACRNYAEAVAVFESQADGPNSRVTDLIELAMIHAEQAEALRGAGRPGESEAQVAASFRRVDALKAPTNNNVRYIRALANLERGQTLALDPSRSAEAIRSLEDAATLCGVLVKGFPGTRVYRLMQARVHAALAEVRTADPIRAAADLEAAQSLLGALVKDFPKNGEYQGRLGRLLVKQGLSRSQADPVGAASLLARARGHLRISLEANPDAPEERKAWAAGSFGPAPVPVR